MDAPGFNPSAVAEPAIFQPGGTGLYLTDDPEAIPPDGAALLDNWRIYDRTRLQIRPGYVGALAFVGETHVHTLGRLFQPATQNFIGFVGAGTNLYRGTSTGGFGVVAPGLSGRPITLLPYRPAVSGQPWMIATDTVGMGQISPTGELNTLGLPVPAVLLTSRIADILTTTICSFDGSTAASAWTLTGGVDRTTPVPIEVPPPTAADVTGQQGACVEFSTVPPASIKGYHALFGLPRTMDLTQLQGGFRPATEDDLIHLWLRVNRPGLLEEVKVFFVCASGFSPSIIPGQHETLNTDAFVKTFAGSDFTGFIEGLLSSDQAAQQRQDAEARRDYLENMPDDHQIPLMQDSEGGGSPPPPPPADDPPNTILPETLVPGRNVWTEYGVIGRPLRRADFTRIGDTPGRDWSTITGIILLVQTLKNDPLRVSCDDWYLTGGYGLDSSEPGAQPYDYRYTHYHLDTGDEGNPSVEQGESLRLQALRQRIAVRPLSPYVGFGSTRIRQRFYRRGGLLTDDWYYLGQNTSNGGEFVDSFSDLEVSTAGTLQIDNYQAVPSQTSGGAVVLAQPLPAIWGPVDGALYACGDPNRPGYVYRSKTGRAGSWPPDLATEVCAPSEELLHGFVYGGQGFVASRRRIFALAQNAATGQVVPQDTLCLKGFAGRWAYAVGPAGCYFVSDDGVYLFTGSGAPTRVSEAIGALWRGVIVGGYLPIDFVAEHLIRLFLDRHVLYFCYGALTTGTRVTLAYSLLTGGWSRDVYAQPIASVYWDAENPELPTFLGGAASGAVYAQGGMSDAGTPIIARYIGPASTIGRPREEKQLADLTVRAGYVPADVVGVALSLDGRTPLDAGVVPATTRGDARVTLDPGGGATDRRGRTFQPSLAWTQPIGVTQAGELHQIQVQAFPLGEETFKRVGQWEPLGPTGAYLIGVAITVDTSHQEQDSRGVEAPHAMRSVLVEYSRSGLLSTLGPFSVDASAGRRTLYLSWVGVRADQVRLVPQDDAPWLVYKLAWLQQPEPPPVLVADSGEEIHADTYYTGLDLTLRAEGDVEVNVYVDNVSLLSHLVPWVGVRTEFVHITIPPGYGHVYRFVAASPVPFTLYSHSWILVPQPGEQTHWNQPFTPAGTLGDKWIKGVLLDCDTGGLIKTVNLEVDGVVVMTFPVETTGRGVVHVSFPQVRGRILRMLPTDAVPSRLWAAQWIFDEEPLELRRWETQLLDHQQESWHTVWEVNLEYRAPAPVTLQVRGFDDQGVQLFADNYLLEATLTGSSDGPGEKRKFNLPLQARKAVLWKYLFTSLQGFWLYREGSSVTLLTPAGAKQVKPFGNDDLDHNRAMGNASGIAATPNQGRQALVQTAT